MDLLDDFGSVKNLGKMVVERILSAVMNAEVGGESLVDSIKIAVLPIAKVLTVCFLGFLMASKYVNVLPAHGRKLLNGVSNLFLYDISSKYIYVCVCIS